MFTHLWPKSPPHNSEVPIDLWGGVRLTRGLPSNPKDRVFHSLSRERIYLNSIIDSSFVMEYIPRGADRFIIIISANIFIYGFNDRNQTELIGTESLRVKPSIGQS